MSLQRKQPKQDIYLCHPYWSTRNFMLDCVLCTARLLKHVSFAIILYQYFEMVRCFSVQKFRKLFNYFCDFVQKYFENYPEYLSQFLHFWDSFTKILERISKILDGFLINLFENSLVNLFWMYKFSIAKYICFKNHYNCFTKKQLSGHFTFHLSLHRKIL